MEKKFVAGILILFLFSNSILLQSSYFSSINTNPFANMLSIDFKRSQERLDIQSSFDRSTMPAVRVIDGKEVYLMLPPENTNINGIALLFHGCNRNGIDWMNLPEDRQIVNHLTSEKRGLVAIALNSDERKHSRCWSNDQSASSNIDISNVKKIVSTLVIELFGLETKMEDVSIYAIGASSGGWFIQILMQALPLNGMVSIISPGWIQMLEQKSIIPRIAFIYMERDRMCQENVKEAVALIQARHFFATSFECTSKNVTQEWLYPHLSHLLSPLQVSMIIQTLVDEPYSLLDKQTGQILRNPRTNWKSIQSLDAFQTLSSSKNTNDLILASIEELLNLAYAQHEITSDYIDEAMDFILK